MAVKAPATSRYTEVERKFDVVESTVSPSFDGIAAVARVQKSPTQVLDAVYFDTPGRDLACKGVTLRRRAGGSDEGWHLKLPAGPDARTEVRAPLDAAQNGGADQMPRDVPDELVDVVRAIVRDRPLSPVARITTARDVHLLYGADGAVLAEFCDDQVTAWAAGAGDDEPAEQRWREWELELSTPDASSAELLDRLGNRLLDAGAVPARHGSKLARVLGVTQDGSPESAADPVQRALAEQVDSLLVWDRAVRADTEDAVHQMRVTTRKIRSLLQAAQDSFGLSGSEWILDELRELAGVLGVARDAEVLAERYQQALEQLPPELVRGRVRERLVDEARRRYQTGLHRTLLALRTKRYFRLLDALEAVATKAPAGPPEQAPVTIEAAHKRVRKAAKAAAEAEEAQRNEALHRIRKKAKRLRYTAAAINATKVAEQAKAVQTLLGDHQDSVVSRQHLIHQADAAHAAGEDTFTYGVLYQQEADLAQKCREQLQPALQKLDKAVRDIHR
jgi:CHAD domain-containing protein